MQNREFRKGVIEGFYGEPWTWAAREAYAPFLRENGFQFYFYAPKGDPFFRKQWRDPFPSEHRARLEGLVDHYHRHGLRFGVGLSPYDVFRRWNDETRASLTSRLELLDAIGVDTVAILFDDMRGDLPELAEVQLDILHWVRDRTRARELLFCPTYYSFDPILDKVFGQRPAGYLERLGRELDPSIDLFWTGEKVCSIEYPDAHLAEVGELLGRKPFLWDNYPVNDGQSMCKFLKLRAVTGRPHTLRDRLAGHAVNPMNQAELSKIPLLSLAESYAREAAYDSHEAFRSAARRVGGPDLLRLLERDASRFQDDGLTKLDAEEKARLRAEYAALGTQAGREVTEWLDGRFEVTRELVLTQ
jgi:hyaluronoglucosaminidase